MPFGLSLFFAPLFAVCGGGLLRACYNSLLLSKWLCWYIYCVVIWERTGPDKRRPSVLSPSLSGVRIRFEISQSQCTLTVIYTLHLKKSWQQLCYWHILCTLPQYFDRLHISTISRELLVGPYRTKARSVEYWTNITLRYPRRQRRTTGTLSKELQ